MMFRNDYRIYAEDDVEHDSLLDSMPLKIYYTMYTDDVPVHYIKSAPYGDDIYELSRCLNNMKKAFDMPILSKKNFPKEYKQ